MGQSKLSVILCLATPTPTTATANTTSPSSASSTSLPVPVVSSSLTNLKDRLAGSTHNPYQQLPDDLEDTGNANPPSNRPKRNM